MTDTKRIQLRRTKGWRLPLNARSVARPHRWGNPFKVGPDLTRVQAVDLYREWLRHCPELVAAARLELAGRDLACFCPLTEPCHADVLLDVVRGGDVR